MKKTKIPYLFLFFALISLLMTVFLGCIAGFQYLFPEILKPILPFYKTRPLHVFFVVSWLVSSISSGVYYHFSHDVKTLFSEKIATIHFILFLAAAIAILSCFMLGIFGGREYFAFPPILAIPIIIGWLCFGLNFFKSIQKEMTSWPVYYWMWMTGIIFFFITFCESYLWLIPYFRDDIVREMTVQWKAFGALVGSLNMLMYGLSIYIMCRIQGSEKTAHGFMPFFLYFIGLTNLMFGWGHHSYILPFKPWLRHFAYFISMSELILLGLIIWNWKKTLQTAQKYFYCLPYRFLISSEIWVFLNIILALLMSVPVINYFTHGTYITVAHTMGTTIGINTHILLAFVFFFAQASSEHFVEKSATLITRGLYLLQGSLLVFWLSLILGGIKRSYWMYLSPDQLTAFGQMQIEVRPYLIVFAIAGLGILTSMFMIVLPPLKEIGSQLFSKHHA